MHIAIEKGKMLIIKVLAVGSVNEHTGTRDVWFEVNGEVSFHLNVSYLTVRAHQCDSHVLSLLKISPLLSKL